MGMYDHVTGLPEIVCRGCGRDISGEFQTKDGPCNFESIPFWECEEFYTSCECSADRMGIGGHWYKYQRKDQAPGGGLALRALRAIASDTLADPVAHAQRWLLEIEKADRGEGKSGPLRDFSDYEDVSMES